MFNLQAQYYEFILMRSKFKCSKGTNFTENKFLELRKISQSYDMKLELYVIKEIIASKLIVMHLT